MLARRAATELVGTFMLVFAGCGAIVADVTSGGALTPVGVALAFGLVVGCVIYAVGDISGAHLNPAVSLSFLLARRVTPLHFTAYAAAQSAGALAASTALLGIFPEASTLGATSPRLPLAAAFALEAGLTFCLMFVIINLAVRDPETRSFGGAAIGGTVALGALVGGPFTGASMNPARSLGPALLSGQLDGLWLYLTAPCAGAALAIPWCRITRGGDCCRG